MSCSRRLPLASGVPRMQLLAIPVQVVFVMSSWGTKVLKELFQQYKDAGGNWYESEIYFQHEQTNEVQRQGERAYTTLKDLRKELGELLRKKEGGRIGRFIVGGIV